MSSDFVLVSEALIEDRIGVKKFRSQKTGLSVVFVGVPGPAVNGYFCLATETDCDDGLPHTLEHLIFLGSDDYPFKGVLDSLANRCLAIGTNAWTATDHTCYTINCAGYEGFLNILPVYVDHILWATLTDDGFYTEVHHINEEGKDAGVVYCEMEGRENTMISRMYRRLHQLLFPDPSCYNKETGGICLNLRSLKVDKVRKYHEDYYKAPNLTLVITGQVPEDKVMEKLEEVQAKILRKAGERPQLLDFSRPWQTPIPDFPSSVLSTVEFPADDEDTGSVMVGWRTCSASDYDTIAALVVLREYLSDSVISPLQQEFVNIAEPLCSSLHFGDCSYSTIAIYLMFQAVPTAKLEFIREKLFEKLQKIHDSEGIDMERIQTVLKRTRLSHKETLEDSPHDTLAGMMIHEFLYGSRDPAEEGQQIASLTRLSERTIEFAAKDQSFWLGLLKRYFIDSPHAFVIGKPSTSLGEEMAKAEEKRIEAQREQIGEEGLAKLEEDLEGAMDRNDTPVPDEMIEKFQVPDTSKIPLIDITTVRDSEKIVSASKPANANADRLFDTLVADDNEPLPLFVQFDEIESEFVLINVFIDTTTLPQNLRQYLEIYLEAIFECPILRRNPDGTTSQISHEEVVKELNTHTVSYYNSLGFGGGNFSCGSFAQEACLSIKSEVSKYQENVRRLSEFLYDSLFTTERLLISAKKLDQNATDKRRKAAHVAGAMLRQINYSPVSNHHATISIRQQATLRRFIESFGTPEGSESILQELEQFRKELTHPSNLKVQVVGPIHKLTNPKKTWRSVFLPPTFAPFSRDELLNKRSATLSKSLKTEQSAGGQNVIAGLASVESCELYQTTNWDCDFKDLSKVAAMMVLLEYLTTMEGPFWKQIRGQGLSYGYNIHPNVETCLLTFSLSRSNSVIKAYQEAVSIINDFVSGEEEFEELYVEAARSSCIFATIDKEQTPSDAATQSFVGFLKGVETRALLHHIEKVQIADVTEALKSVSRLFDPALTNTSLVCNVSKVPEIVEGFRQEFGKNFTVIENLDEFFVAP